MTKIEELPADDYWRRYQAAQTDDERKSIKEELDAALVRAKCLREESEAALAMLVDDIMSPK